MADRKGRYILVSQAAVILEITPQAVRDKVRSGQIAARTDSRPWTVSAADVNRLATEGSEVEGRRMVEPPVDANVVTRLRARIDQLESDLAKIAVDRDRYRADASAAREAGLAMSGSAADLVEATKRLTAALENQIAASIQLLAPGSPADLGPASVSQESD